VVDVGAAARCASQNTRSVGLEVGSVGFDGDGLGLLEDCVLHAGGVGGDVSLASCGNKTLCSIVHAGASFHGGSGSVWVGSLGHNWMRECVGPGIVVPATVAAKVALLP